MLARQALGRIAVGGAMAMATAWCEATAGRARSGQIKKAGANTVAVMRMRASWAVKNSFSASSTTAVWKSILSRM